MDYKSAGVDIEKGDLFVEKISSFIKETYDSRVVSGVGGFAALYEIDEDRLLASGTDGVGTKVKLAQELGIHNTIGQDLVAMCVNDVLCTGARPLFFLDYLATGKLDLEVSTQIVRGIVDACKLAGCALIGGETAEMPGVYAEGVYDLAGFSVGEVFRKDLMDGSRTGEDQWIIGLKSSGFHSNGFSLVRKLIRAEETELKTSALTPTRIYVKLIHALLKDQRENITGLAHITGGGLQNIPRINEALGYDITQLPGDNFRPAFMNEICSRTTMSKKDLYETFNMGVGFVLTVKDIDSAKAFLEKNGEQVLVMGKTTKEFAGIRAPGIHV
jgi:phosphoribosylformylglycinamidine cyclo-ligase